MKMKRILLIALMVIIVGFLSGCTSNYEKTSNNNDIYVPKFHTVVYEVTGVADSVSVTYTNSNGGTSQRAKVSLTWSYTLRLMERGDFVYISAQNNGDWGTVEVNIYVDDVRVKHSFSSGAYVIATASGIL